MANLNRFGTRLDHFSRRRFLGGAAAIVGLPALEVLNSRLAKAQQNVPIRRLLCIASGSGVPMDEFTPTTTGVNYELTGKLVQSFAPIKSKVSLFTGLGIDEGAHSPGDHGAGVPVTFTCTTPAPQYSNTNSQNYTGPAGQAGLGPSIDQVMAAQVGGMTRIPAGLQLGLADGLPLGDGPYGPVYLKNLSWKSATEWVSPVLQPAAVFDNIFNGYDPNASAAESALRLRRRISVLDYVAQESASLLPALNKDDRQRLDQYFTQTREVETTLQTAAQQGGGMGAGACNPGMRPASNLSYADTMKAMSNLIALAFTCDATRTVMLQLSCYRNDAMYAGFLGVNDNHHSLSHAGNVRSTNPDSGWRIVCRWLMDQIGALFITLDSIKEPNGMSVLENSIAVYNNDDGWGDIHDHKNLPVIVAGSAGGNIPTGRYFKFPSNTPCGGLYVTLLQALGVNIKTFGQKNSGPLALPA